jgi:cytochrome c
MSLISKPLGFALVAVAAAVLLIGSQPANAQQGKTLYTQKGCPACHGPDGNTPLAPNYPKLKGQNAEYMIAQIKSFKSGERKGGLSALMAPMSAMVNDQEADTIAKWLMTGK